MRVQLVNPATSFEQIYGDWDLSALDTYTTPLGIMHVASYIREHGHQPSIVDLQVHDWDTGAAAVRILANTPDVVGISAMTINILNAGRLAEQLRERGFAGPIVLGGPHVTAVPVETLGAFRFVDFGVVGEGEETFLELIESLENGGPLDGVRGVVRRNRAGDIVLNQPRPFIDDLDVLPMPSWDLLEGFPASYPSSLLESRRLPAAGIMTSRGCPFHCTFCDNRVFGTKVRHFSAGYSLRMIRHLISEYGVRDLMFFDDNLLLSKRKLLEICEGIVEEKMDLTWYCISHAKSMTEPSLKTIKRAGCWFVEMGIESGNNGILKSIRKSTSKQEIARAASNARKVGLRTKGNFIFGFPGDTPATLEETIQFALDIDIDFFQQSYLTVWPGCELFGEVKGISRNGDSVSAWGNLAHQRVSYVPPALTEGQLIAFSRRAFRKFYLRPKIVLRLLPLFMSARGLRLCIVALFAFLRTVIRRR